MLSLFRNRRKSRAALNKSQDKLAHSIVNTCIRLQSKLSLWMQKQSERLSIKTKFVLLLLFIATGSSYSLYLVIGSFSPTKTSSTPITINTTDPAYQIDKVKHETFISQDEYYRIHKFKLFMDSLPRSPTNKSLYDSIMADRPGLLDTILLIEENYQSQLKK